MKKWISIAAMAVLLIFPNAVMAHTHMTSSLPEDGSTVTEPLKTIELTFDTKIEPLSSMKLVKDGSEVPVEVKAEGEKLIGTPQGELENGAYTAEWKIIGEDGHEMEGTLAFNVQQEAAEEAPQTDEEAPQTEEPGDSGESEEEAAKEQPADEQTGNAEASEEGSPVMTIALAAIGVLAVIFIISLMRKKR
ncbi:copper resistance protein CopC [Metabacillus sp. JX24]|uniref:copper resistance CopC family protein n=1 Tax=Metabacillus sp. JX24 TaxID=3240759 RepID=UPI00350FC68B